MMLTTRRSFFILNAFGASRAVCLIFCLLLMCAATARAQNQQLPPPPLPEDPTPLVDLISVSERDQVAGADNPKEQIETYLKIADAHLEQALTALREGNQHQSERDLDIYNKALAEAGKIAFGQPKGKRGLAKKIEQKLYKQMKTLDVIVRSFPVERLGFAEKAIKKARQLRVQAINEAFAAGDVLDDPTKEKKPEDNPPAKDDSKRDGSGARSSAGKHSFTGERSFASKHSFAGANAFTPVALSSRPASQIPGDYLNEEEDDFVRKAQDPDLRIRVFMKIADRRLAALSAPTAAPTDKKAQEKAEKELRIWGAVPKVERAELLRHYARAIEEAIAKLEDAHERNPKSSMIPKALTFMRDSTDKHLEILRSLEAEMKTEAEIAAFRLALDQAQTANTGAREGLKAKSQ